MIMSTNLSSNNQFCGRTRREFLWETGAGFGAAALTGMLSADGFFDRQACRADWEVGVHQPDGAEEAALHRPRPRA